MRSIKNKRGIISPGRIKKNTIPWKIYNKHKNDLIFLCGLNESTGLIAYDMSTNGVNGDYISVALANADAPAGVKCPLFDAITSNVNFNNQIAELAAAFTNKSEFAAIAHWKVTGAPVWTDGQERKLFEIYSDSDNQMKLVKDNVNNQIEARVKVGGQAYTAVVSGVTSLDWLITGFRFYDSGSGNKSLAVYCSGVLCQTDVEAAQDWAGDPTKFRVGSNRNGIHVFDGWIGTVGMINGDPGDAEMIRLTTLRAY